MNNITTPGTPGTYTVFWSTALRLQQELSSLEALDINKSSHKDGQQRKVNSNLSVSSELPYKD